MPPTSTHRFRARLAAEEAAMARHGHSSCVVRFRAPDDAGVARLHAVVADTKRLADEVAEPDGSTLSVLLPHTTADGAAVFAERIAAAAADDAAATWEVTPLEVERTTPGERRNGTAADVAAGHGTGTDGSARGSTRVRTEPLGVSLLLSRPLPWWKRGVDVVLASLGLVLCSPFMLIAAIAIKATSPGPVIFVQKRTGRNMERFRLLKFRSMVTDPQAHLDAARLKNDMEGSPLFKMDDDPRLTRVGKLLRRTSFDEVPQLWNVLKGDITIIGPRALSPVPARYEPWQLRRFDVTPGVACDWQADRRSETDYDEWMRSDVRYAERGASVLGDLWILLRTIRSVARCGGR